jgi:hypothetical protein
MPTLGICVTTPAHAPHLLGLAAAAGRAGFRIDVFVTGDGVELLRCRGLERLPEQGHRVGVCEVSARQRGLPPGTVPWLRDKDFVTQARNAELVERCDRYLVL